MKCGSCFYLIGGSSRYLQSYVYCISALLNYSEYSINTTLAIRGGSTLIPAISFIFRNAYLLQLF